jgi:uncharacterized integral membrane protein
MRNGTSSSADSIQWNVSSDVSPNLIYVIIIIITIITIIIIIIIIIINVVSCHRSFLPGTSLEPAVIPNAQASSFTLQYFLYYV